MILLLSVTLPQLPQQVLTKPVTSTAKKPTFTVKVQPKHKASLNNRCTLPTCPTTNTTTCLTSSTHTNNPRTVNPL